MIYSDVSTKIRHKCRTLISRFLMVSYIPFIYSSTFLKMSRHQQEQQLEEPDSRKLAAKPTVIIAWTQTESMWHKKIYLQNKGRSFPWIHVF